MTIPKEKQVALYTNDLHVWYVDNEAIKGVDLEFEKNKITALIGHSGCGKSTYLRSLNRNNDGISNTKITGKIMYKDVDINAPQEDVYEIRKRIG
ncbi:ATP-binding cassette domain-containing protein, partial [Enterococcus faecium]|uniref:ATP-binding cassette domain-containing protein n=1 Tax=Enterococcus faecium TaxID=1352 RepID=UPI003CD0528D